MARRYAPALRPLVLKALHHEAARRGIPMTELANTCLRKALHNTPGWKQATTELDDQPAGPSRSTR